MSEPSRPILMWHGGKWLLAPWIIAQFPPHRRYIEPFGGAASVLIRKERSFSEIYNDLDKEVVNLFRVARDQGPELRERLRLTPFAREEFVESRLPSPDPMEQARRTVIRSFMGFGSNSHNKTSTGFRARSERSGTTPAHDWINYPDCFTFLIERLRGVVIENRPALDVIAQCDMEGALIYADPPYAAETRDAGADYRHEMTSDDHRALAEVLSKVKASVVVSGYDCPLYSEIYEGWERIEKTGPFCDMARERTEVLWLRNCDHGLFSNRNPATHPANPHALA